MFCMCLAFNVHFIFMNDRKTSLLLFDLSDIHPASKTFVTYLSYFNFHIKNSLKRFAEH